VPEAETGWSFPQRRMVSSGYGLWMAQKRKPSVFTYLLNEMP
jgi:hypothetical protein